MRSRSQPPWAEGAGESSAPSRGIAEQSLAIFQAASEQRLLARSPCQGRSLHRASPGCPHCQVGCLAASRSDDLDVRSLHGGHWQPCQGPGVRCGTPCDFGLESEVRARQPRWPRWPPHPPAAQCAGGYFLSPPPPLSLSLVATTVARAARRLASTGVPKWRGSRQLPPTGVPPIPGRRRGHWRHARPRGGGAGSGR